MCEKPLHKSKQTPSQGQMTQSVFWIGGIEAKHVLHFLSSKLRLLLSLQISKQMRLSMHDIAINTQFDYPHVFQGATCKLFRHCMRLAVRATHFGRMFVQACC